MLSKKAIPTAPEHWQSILRHMVQDAPPTFLMCPPTYYAVTRPANYFAREEGVEAYRENPAEVRGEAMEQWETLKQTLEGLGAEVAELPPISGYDDLVYTADASQSFCYFRMEDGEFQPTGREMTLLSHFSNAEREQEVAQHDAFFRAHYPDRPLVRAHMPIEGTGDNVYDVFRHVMISGHGIRSEEDSHAKLEALTGIEVVPVALKEPFFHVDTCIAPMAGGHLLCHVEGIEPDSWASFKARMFEQMELPIEEYLIPVSKEDALSFACNIVPVGQDIVLPKCSDALIAAIESRGYRCHPVDVSALMLGGGGSHCMTNNVTRIALEGGVHSVIFNKA